MDAAVGADLPTAHMGGIGGFVSLADGIDRALAGVEPGFSPDQVHNALAGPCHNLEGLRATSKGTGRSQSSTSMGRAGQQGMAALRNTNRRPLPAAGRLTALRGGSPSNGRPDTIVHSTHANILDREDLLRAPMSRLRALAQERRIDPAGCFEKSDLVERLVALSAPEGNSGTSTESLCCP